MAMYHLINCAALTFVPFIILFKTTKLSEYNAIWCSTWAALAFTATYLAKIVVMAAVLPSTDSSGSFTQEVLAIMLNGITLFGLYFSLQRIPGLSRLPQDLKILAVGLGWAFADSVAHYAIPMVIGARGMEFSWEFIEMGVESNINMFMSIAVAGCVWLWSRRDLVKSQYPFVVFIALLHMALPSLCSYLKLSLHMGTWQLLAFRALIAIAAGVSTQILISLYLRTKSQKA